MLLGLARKTRLCGRGGGSGWCSRRLWHEKLAEL